MPNIWLYQGEATPQNVVLADPTQARGGHAYTQALAGAISTLTGALSAMHIWGKVLAGAISTLTGGLTKQAVKALAGTISTLTGVLAKREQKMLAGAIATLTGALSWAHTFAKALTGAIATITGALTKRDNKALAGAIATITGGLVKKTARALAGALSTITGVLTKAGQKVLAGAVSTLTGALSTTHAWSKALAGSVSTLTGTLAKNTQKGLAGAISTITGALSWIHPNIYYQTLYGYISTLVGQIYLNKTIIRGGMKLLVELIQLYVHPAVIGGWLVLSDQWGSLQTTWGGYFQMLKGAQGIAKASTAPQGNAVFIRSPAGIAHVSVIPSEKDEEE